MEVLLRNTPLWNYLPDELKGLINDGEKLALYVQKNKDNAEITDFSFLVFPFAKAYEGFLKQLFLDIGLIKHDEYYGDEIRIGRLLNPNYQIESGNLFRQLCEQRTDGITTAQRLWDVWKRGRNSVFHYFPHNFRRLSYEEALDIINETLKAMQEVVVLCGVK